MQCVLCGNRSLAGPDVVCASCVVRIADLRAGVPEQYMTLELVSYGFWWHPVGAPYKTLCRTSSELQAYEGQACAALIVWAARVAAGRRSR